MARLLHNGWIKILCFTMAMFGAIGMCGILLSPTAIIMMAFVIS